MYTKSRATINTNARIVTSMSHTRGDLACGLGRSGAAAMLSFPAAIKVYLCTVPCDMRRSFDGLSMMAEHVIGCNPYAGHLLVFSNRRTDRVKILYWDRDGWAIWYKRL